MPPRPQTALARGILYLDSSRPACSFERDIDENPERSFLVFSLDVHLESSVNQSEFVAQSSCDLTKLHFTQG